MTKGDKMAQGSVWNQGKLARALVFQIPTSHSLKLRVSDFVWTFQVCSILIKMQKKTGGVTYQ